MHTTYAEFEARVRAQGFTDVLVREWAPGTVLDTHVHPFDAQALVVQGEMWLTVAGATRHLLPGDGFEVPRNTAHAERYGHEGASYWVGRRGAAA